MKTIIHVDQHVLHNNRKTGAPIIVKQGKKNLRAQSVAIMGPAFLQYRPEKTLRCGATIWIETTSDVLTFV